MSSDFDAVDDVDQQLRQFLELFGFAVGCDARRIARDDDDDGVAVDELELSCDLTHRRWLVDVLCALDAVFVIVESTSSCIDRVVVRVRDASWLHVLFALTSSNDAYQRGDNDKFDAHSSDSDALPRWLWRLDCSAARCVIDGARRSALLLASRARCDELVRRALHGGCSATYRRCEKSTQARNRFLLFFCCCCQRCMGVLR